MVIVSEGTGGDRRAAETAVSVIRDIFAEGVAYRVGEALSEAFHEAGERISRDDLRGCSVTAAAFSGDEVWIVHAGAGRAFLSDGRHVSPLTAEHTLANEMGLSPGDPAWSARSRDLTLFLGQKDLKPQTVHLRLEEGRTVLLMTSGIWHHLAPGRIAAVLKDAHGNPADALERLVRESRARFRRRGGAAAIVGEGRSRAKRGRGLRLIPFLAVSLAVAVLAVVAGRGIFCGGADDGRAGGGSRPDSVVTVMPLDIAPPDTARPAAPAPPIPSISFGTDPAGLGSDTLDIFVTAPPDPLYEELASGVYCLAGDSAALPAAAAAAAGSGLPGPIPLDGIVVVRETGVPAFAAWLPGVDSASAARTAVIVETRSSVAGGAPWIRRFAIYANGDRSRQGEESCCLGTLPEGVPASADSSCYRILIVP